MSETWKNYVLNCFREAVQTGIPVAMLELRKVESKNQFDFSWDFAFDALLALAED